MKRYSVKAIFSTLQGEGARAGTRNVWVRFHGCNLWNGKPVDRAKGDGACASWCDSSFARETADRAPYTTQELLAAMHEQWPAEAGTYERTLRWCVLSGGEPALQVDLPLVDALHDAGWKVAMETNGTVAVHDLGLDWVCVSPKLSSHDLLVTHADEVKVVLPGAGGDYGAWTDAALCTLRANMKADHYFVQPQDCIDPRFVNVSQLVRSRMDAKTEGDYNVHIERCIAFVMAHPEWRLSTQQHKNWGVE